MVKFCSLVSGSSGNALYLEYKKTKILIDCGVSCKRVCDSLKQLDVSPQEIDAIVVTHEHSDHTSGIEVFTKKFGTEVYASGGTLSKIPFCSDGIELLSGKSCQVGDIEIAGFDIPHDATQPFGYVFMAGEKKLAVATDMGKIDLAVAQTIRGSNLAFIEANHDVNMLRDGPYPTYLKNRIRSSEGHLSNDQCAELAAALARTGTENIILGHLSATNNTPETAMNAVGNVLKKEGFSIGKDITLDVAERYVLGNIYNI